MFPPIFTRVKATDTLSSLEFPRRQKGQSCGFAQSTCAGPCANGTHLCPPAGQFQSPTLTSYSGTWASSCHSIFWNPGLLVESTATSWFRMASGLCFLPQALDEHWQVRPHWACVAQPLPADPLPSVNQWGEVPMLRNLSLGSQSILLGHRVFKLFQELLGLWATSSLLWVSR